MKKEYVFQSLFAERIRAFMAFKIATGFKKCTYFKYMKFFDIWCLRYYPQEEILTEEMVMKYSRRRACEQPVSQKCRVGKLRMLAEFIVRTTGRGCLVPHGICEKVDRNLPYILTEEERRKFFSAADSYPQSSVSPNKHIVIPVMLRLSLCCGLRPQELRHIKLEDISFRSGTIIIRASKNRKDRKIVMNDDLCLMLMKYTALMTIRQPYSTYLFERPEGGPYRCRWWGQCVKEIAGIAGLMPHGETTMRAYDLRHNYATSMIMKWKHEGRDIDNCLVYMSEYMGHSKLEHTVYYITLIPEMFQEWQQMEWADMDLIPEPEEDFWS